MKVIYISRAQAIRTLVVLTLVIISIVYTQNTEYDAISVFLNTKRELPIYSVETDEKKIAISFDAAWGAEYTDEILDILKKRNIKTTFFLVGFWVDKYPEQVKRIASEGHEIGNHSTTHPHMSQLSSEQIRMEIETTQKKIEELAGDRAVKLFRPPFGDYNDRLILTCREMGFYPIQWDVDSLDWKEYGVDHMFNQVIKKVRSGSIVLFHNNAKYIVQALPLILDHILEEGYSIVPISELIYKDNYYIDHTGRQKKK
ncbi:MAG: polysaccharide deacetylase family protein [Clostridiales bacterium]|jgi:polysaccharide deacetylase family sporulation protein PdaB|nr:polysaccharide deacetylase family protein [Clostridiales bacterium]